METQAQGPARWNPLSWPIAAKIVVALLAVSLVPMLLVAWVSLQGGLASLGDTELKNLKQIAANISGRIGQLINDTRQVTAFLADDPALDELLQRPTEERKEAVRGKLHSLLATNRDVELIMLLDAGGSVVTSTDPALIGRNFKFREYFVNAIQGRAHTTGIIVGAVAGNYGAFFSAPVTDQRGTVRGAAVVRILGGTFAAIVEDERQAKQRVGFVVDGDGVVIYHPDPKVQFRSLAPLDDAAQKRIAADQRFRRDRIESLGMGPLAEAAVGSKDAGFVRYRSPLSGEPEIAGFAPVRNHHWTVVVSASEAYFSRALQELFWKVVVSVILVGVVFVLLAMLFARSLVRPLRSLIAAAQSLSRGEYEHAEARVFTEDEIGQLAKTFNAMVASVRERDRERDVFGRVVSPEVRDRLLTGQLKLGGESLRVAVLFSDIRGFSAIAERMGANDLVQFLNEYLTEMTEAVKPFGGYVNNFIGDAVVVIFGAPVGRADIEAAAVGAALAMRERLARLNARRREREEPEIQSGIGISTGRAVAGQIGSLERCMYTVIGDAINIAARLEELTKELRDYPILINHATYLGIRDRAEIKALDFGPQKVKGRAEPVHVYAVLPGVPAAGAISCAA